ncbi:hypothetical protein [uncultured Gilliamella sp.]|uniref:hypothetical protein n=1 Tax=uncultured Gilliamella sp. TaxID=1193505 RepID=UPI0025CEA3FC|nr:hypothetical protein [uncultured Gilliamella sp.]
MPSQFRQAQTSFSSGEISPEMYGRTDTAKHQNGLKKAVNAFISPFGGVVRRPGTRFVSQAKYPNKDVILIKFVYGVDQSYMIELGEYYMRFYINSHVIRDQNGDIYEILTRYNESDLHDIKYTQRQDTMFLVHENYPILELKRYGDAKWSLKEAVFDPMPFEETTPTPYAYLKITTADKEIGKRITVTCYNNEAATSKHYGFTHNDIGARISVNSGVMLIEGVNDASDGKYCTATGKVVYALSSTITAIPQSWTLLHPGWSAELGYPSATYIHQQRLIFAASKKFPRKIWMSTTGNSYNFDTADSSDDDALSVSIDDNQGNKIVHLTQDQVLLALTAGNEFSITGGYESGIKPSNINIRLQSAFGCSNVRPINIDSSMFFVQRAGKQIKAITNGGYYGTDVEWSTLSEMSRHLLTSGIKSMTYQQDPNSMIFVVCNDGKIAVLTYNSEQEVAGWGSFETQGQYLYVCCIPEKHKDVVYTAVKRYIDGEPVVCIEVFDPDLNTDCAIPGKDTEGADVWTGFDHLNGHTVAIVADGVVMPEQRVTNGSITLTRNAKDIEVGINYETHIDLLFQDFPTATGSTVGTRLTLSDVTFKFHKTKGASVYLYGANSKQILTSRKFGTELLDKGPQYLSPSIKLDSLGWNINEINLTIKQTQPLPFHLMSVSYVVTAG